MHDFLENVRKTWQWMLEPPWRHSDNGKQNGHWATWLLGWPWTLAGLVGGALVAPALVQAVGLANTSYHDWLVLAIAVVGGLLVQVVGWLLLALLAVVTGITCARSLDASTWASLLFLLAFGVVVLFPLAGVVYGIYRYFSWIGPGQRSVLLAFVGGLLITKIVVPFISGTFIKRFLNWLRGKDKKTN